MAAIFQIRRGTTTESLTEGELYLHQTSGSLQIGSGSSVVTMAKLNEPNIGNFNVTGDVTIGGTITIGDSTTDSIIFNADLSSSIIPNSGSTYDLGSTDSVYRNVYATSISGAIAATNGVISGSSQLTSSYDARYSLSGSIPNIPTGSFATTGSNTFTGNQTISASLSVIGDGRGASVNPGVVLIHSGSSTATFAPNSVVLIHTESVGNSNIIGFSASPTHFSVPGLANVNEPSIFTADSSGSYYQAIEFQSQGRFAQNKVSFKVPVDVSGSLTISGSTTQIGNQTITGSVNISGSTTQVGNIVLTGSLTISGSSTFRNIGPTILSGSVLVSGSINSDGFELDASLTQNIPALNTAFNLDFSGSGEYGGTNFINKSLVLGDGKVLVAGRFQSIDGHITNDIARLNSNGTIDTSFSSPIFGYTFGGDYYGYINTFVTQSDNKILVGGNFDEVNGSAREGIARLNTNGTLDTSFAVQSWGSFGEVKDIAIQNDDKIVVVGYFTSGSRRINTDGTLDTSFNVSSGSNQPSFFNNDYFHSVALLNSGSEQAILIGGSFQQWGSLSDYHHLVKLHPSGALDLGFAGTNLNIATGNSLDRIKKIKVTDAYSAGDNGYIYIAGRFKDTRIGAQGRNAGFARLETEDNGVDGRGAFDSGFRLYISGSDQNNPGAQYVNDFDFYDGDKILLGGSFTSLGNPLASYQTTNRFIIVNNDNGSLIDGFSSSTYNLNTGSVNSVTLLPNDNVLVGGTFTQANSTAREGLASLKLAGLGNVTTTSEYSITANVNELLISSSNTYFSGYVSASVISSSFVGDGSGLTGIAITDTTGYSTFSSSIATSFSASNANLNSLSSSISQSIIDIVSASLSSSLSVIATDIEVAIVSASLSSSQALISSSISTSIADTLSGSVASITTLSSSVSASLASLSASSGFIQYVTNSVQNLTGIEVADFDSNVAVTFINGTLKFIFGTPAIPTSIATSLSGFAADRFNNVNDAYIVNGTWSNQGYTLVSASLYEGSTLLTEVGSGTSLSYNATTSGSHTYRLEYTASSPLDGTLYKTSTTAIGTISKSNPASPTISPTVTVQLGASSNQIEQGATGSISFTSSSADPSNSWNFINTTTNVSTPYFVTGSATGSTSISIIATANYESPIGDNIPDLTTTSTATTTYTKIRSLRYGASVATSFTEGELENIGAWDTTLGGNIGTIAKGTTTASGQSVTISWTGDKYHYIVFDSARPNLTNITSAGFGLFGSFTLTTVGQYKVYKIGTLQAGGAGSSITYILT